MDKKIAELTRIQRDFMRLHFELNHKTAGELGLYYGQPAVLMILLDHGEMSQKEIAKEMNITPASVNVSIKRLEKAGLVQKSISRSDRRVTFVCLTDKGRDTAVKCREGFDKNDEILFKGFSGQELDLMKRCFEKMSENMKRGDRI